MLMKKSTQLFIAGVSLGALLNGFDYNTEVPSRYGPAPIQGTPQEEIDSVMNRFKSEIPYMSDQWLTFDLFGMETDIPFYFRTLEFPDGEKVTGLVDGHNVLTFNGTYKVNEGPFHLHYFERP